MGRRGCILGLLQLGDAVSAQPLVLLLLAAPPLPLLLQLRLHCLHRLPALRRHLLQLWRERESEEKGSVRERERGMMKGVERANVLLFVQFVLRRMNGRGGNETSASYFSSSAVYRVCDLLY